MLPILKTIFLMLIYISGAAFLYWTFGELDIDAALPMQGLAQIGFLLAPLIILLNIEKTSLESLIGTHKPPIRVYITCLFGLFGLIFFNAGVLSIQELILPQSVFDYMNSITEDYNESLSGLLSPNMPIWYVTLIVAVIPAIVEEMLYRGYLQSKLNIVSLPLGFVIIGLIFSLFHFNPISFIGLFFISVYLSFIRYATGSIIPSMVVHFMNNFIMILLYYNVNDALLIRDKDAISETDLGSTLLILVLGLMILLFNSFALYKYKNESNGES